MNEFGTDRPGGEQPTEKMKGVGSSGGGPRGRISALIMALRENPLYAGTAAAVILIAVAVLVIASLISGGSSDSDEGAARYATLQNVGTSWTAGQSSLANYDQFDAIAARANVLGANTQTAFWKGQLQYDDDRVAARKRAQAQARKRYLAARAEAERKYQEALAKAKHDRQVALRKQKEKQAAILRALREKYKIKPGEECSLPEIRARFDCSTGYPF